MLMSTKKSNAKRSRERQQTTEHKIDPPYCIDSNLCTNSSFNA